jgi:hypothetical protein
MIVIRRMTIGLIPAAADALDRIKDRHGYKSVDAVNRALVVYELVDEALAAGKEMRFVSPDGTIELIKII